MSANFNQAAPVGPDTLITVKILIDGQNRRFKLALRDLGAHVLPQKLRLLLQINPDYDVVFERYSDSAGNYVVLDSTNPSVYKQLYRAAKAKLKLRLKVTATPAEKFEQSILEEAPVEHAKQTTRPSYLQTVLAETPTAKDRAASFKAFQQQIHAPSATTLVEPVEAPKPAQAPTDLSRPTIPSFDDFCSGNFSIDCNNCENPVVSEHYHCGICEMGDFDLCPACVRAGVTCDGEDHWLIKRTIKHGRVYPSITEKVPPKKMAEPIKAAPVTELVEEEQRTCNSCIIQLSANSFVSCQTCPDFDLCYLCLENTDHGHHPGHTFAPVEKNGGTVTFYMQALCQQGRGIRHEAVCDGCDSQIIGVRHKCLACPDFDLCSACHKTVTDTHPGHRFAPIYEQLGYLNVRKSVHKGVYCDGVVCTAKAKKTYIRGDRYKCTVCDDTDFCANCESHPMNVHNKTHPLIKLKTPIRQVSISTVNEFDNGQSPVVLGDRSAAQHVAAETVRSTSTNAATQVQPAPQVAAEKSQPDLASKTDELQAWFESDSTPDGSRFGPNRLVSQSWTLRNPGPKSWPTGCAVHFIGGDDIRNLDDKHPSSVSSMTAANQSNALTEPLAPGKTAVFTVLLKSPAREGRAISYWRLKTPEGLPFGHKLWVDITIDAKLSSTKPVEVEAPAVAPVEVPVETAEKSQESSIMIFPKLEKESAESSVNDIKQAVVPTQEPSVTGEDQDLLDDLESMGIEDESTDDGFMTDEEYDILDAEDEDFLAEAQAAAKK